jgi:hypothetical protein
MSTLSLADDEAPIKVLPDTPDWCENYAWAGYDPTSGIGHFFSMGRWLGDIRMWRSITLIALPDGRVLTSKNFGYGNENAASSRELTYTVVEPKKRFQLVFDGPAGSYSAEDLYTRGYYETKPKKLEFVMDFVSDEPLWDLAGHASDADSIVGAGHIEQHGRITGKLRYGDEEFVIHPSYANRDHSRGVRDMTAYKRHCWQNGVFASGMKFYAYYFETTLSDQVMQQAAISKDGVLYAAKVTPCPFYGIEDALQPFTITLESELGTMEIVGTPLNNMPFTASESPYDAHLGWSPSYNFRNQLIFEQSVKWEWVGHETGYGHSERGIKQ